MILLQSHTIWQNFRFVCVIWLLIPSNFLIANESCSNVTPEKAMEVARSLLNSEKKTAAEACLKLSHQKNPTNRDLGYFYARVLAWNQKFTESRSVFSNWKDNDLESAVLKGDLSWYASDFKHAAIAYRKAEVQFSLKKFPKASQLAYVKSLDKFARKPQKFVLEKWQEILEQYPEDEGIQKSTTQYRSRLESWSKSKSKSKSKSQTKKKEETKLYFEVAEHIQSQNQSARELSLGANYLAKGAYFISSKVINASRFYPAETLSDNLIETEFHLFSPKTWTFEMRLGLASKPSFSAKSFQEFGITKSFGKIYTGGYYKVSEYTDNNTVSYSPFIGGYIHSFLMSIRYYSTSTVKHTLNSYLLKFRYINPDWFVETSLSSGDTESSRLYLTKQEVVAFQAIGIKYEFHLIKKFSCFLFLEDKSEPQFSENTVMLGGSWKL